MAHPFSGVPTDYRVESSGVAYWANCAWDALGRGYWRRDTECCAEVELSVRGGRRADRAGAFLIRRHDFWEEVRTVIDMAHPVSRGGGCGRMVRGAQEWDAGR